MLQIERSVARVLKKGVEVSWSFVRVESAMFGTCSLTTVEEFDEENDSKKELLAKASRRVLEGDEIQVEVDGVLVYTGDVISKVLVQGKRVGLVRVALGERILRKAYEKRSVGDTSAKEIVEEICKAHGVKCNYERIPEGELKRWHIPLETSVGDIFIKLLDLVRHGKNFVWYWDEKNVLQFGVSPRKRKRIEIANRDVVSVDGEGVLEVRARYGVLYRDMVVVNGKFEIGVVECVSVVYELEREGKQVMWIYGREWK